MTINDIGGNNFDTFQLYAEMTGNEQDDQILETLNTQILAAVPDATPEQVGEAIDRIKSDNPNWTMGQVFEAAIGELNPDCEADTINQIRSSWQEFTGVSNLSSDDIGEILASPAEFVLTNDASETSIKNTIAILMLLQIDIAGEQSAFEMLEGCAQRDEIMRLAHEKADDIMAKAKIGLAVGLTSSAIQIGASSASMSSASKGLTAAKAGNSGLAQAYGGKSSAYSGLGQGASGAVNAVGGLFTGMKDADIAIKEGESQVASIQKEAADKRKQKLGELIQSARDLLQSMSQADNQTLTTIGRI